MRKLISAVTLGALLMGLGIGISGCSDESSEKATVTTKTPGGTVKQTTETKVETSGDHPPAPTKAP
jgi:hypothetical protein